MTRKAIARALSSFAPVMLTVAIGCGGGTEAVNGTDGTDGTDGAAGSSCSVTDNLDGTKTLLCDDGTTAIVSDGNVGNDGTSCSVADVAGVKTITCTDGTTATVVDGTDGVSCTLTSDGDGTKSITCDDGSTFDIPASELSPGLVIQVTTNAPANTTHFVVGEVITVSMAIWDGTTAEPITPANLSTFRLYMNGPRDVLLNETAADLMRASIDRTASVHHYINLNTTTDTGLVINGNLATYDLSPVAAEPAGTYTIGIRGRSAAFGSTDRVFALHDVQIGTATVEPHIVGSVAGGDLGCTDCHQGAANGQIYLHHVDSGSFELDGGAIRTCKMCHNMEGYASRRQCNVSGTAPVRLAGSNPRVYECLDQPGDFQNWSYLSDSIVRRVHGVHNGNRLVAPFVVADFQDYLGVHFPSDVRNCVKCHKNTDVYKTKPSREACGACHDRVNWDDPSDTAPYFVDRVVPWYTCTDDADCRTRFANNPGAVCNASSLCELQNHPGAVATNATCAVCHDPDVDGIAQSVTTCHTVPPFPFAYTVDLTMTAPANSTHYVAGEAPVITVVVSDAATSNPIDHNQITQASGNFNRVNLFVNGPRAHRGPALTTSARGSVTSTVAGTWDLSSAPEAMSAAGTWDLDSAVDLQIMVDTTAITVPVSAGTFTAGAATAAEVIAWLNADTDFSGDAVATVSGASVMIAALGGSSTTLEVLASDVTTAMGFTAAVYAYSDFVFALDGTSVTLYPADGTFADLSVVTAAEIVAWLNGDADFSGLGFAQVDGGDVTVLCRPSMSPLPLEIFASDVATQLDLTVGVYDGKISTYASNEFWQHTVSASDDPKVTWTTGSVTYQLDDVGSAEPGTYSVWVEIGSYTALPVSWGLLNFQVGTDEVEKKIATNCKDCHENTTMHAGYFAIEFNPDICGSCHDYKRQYPERLASDPLDGWGGNAAPGRSNAGFGGAPIARRIHGVHRGHYLDKPEEVHGSYDYSEVIFPQDIRNCVKCHSETDSWMENPGRIACLACHDSDATIAHGMQMTYDPTPADPWNGDEVESCDTCHGPGKDFAVEDMHNITDPYVRPYPRD